MENVNFENMKTWITYEGTYFSKQFHVNDRTKFEHRHNALYYKHRDNVETNKQINKHTGQKLTSTKPYS